MSQRHPLKRSGRQRRSHFNSDDENDRMYSLPPKEKTWLIRIGKDKMAFQVRIDRKKSFPDDGELTPSMVDRLNFRNGDSFSMFWGDGNETRLITVVFKCYASTYDLGKQLVKKLSKKLGEKMDSVRSASTDSIIRHASLDSTLESVGSEVQTDSEQVQDRDSDETLVGRDQMNHRYEKNLAASQIYDNRQLATQPIDNDNLKTALDTVVKDITTLNNKFDRLSATLGKLESYLHDLKESVQEGFEEMQDNCRRIDKSIATTHKMMPIKNGFFCAQKKDRSLFDDESTLLWLVEKKNIIDIVNRIYLETTQPKDFVIKLVQEMYGDLISYYKFRVVRKYTDGSRLTRTALQEFDPTRKEIIDDCIAKYYEKNADALKLDGAYLSKEDFETFCAEHIDNYSLRTNAKKGLKNPYSKSAKFYEYVVIEGCRPRHDFSMEDKEKVAELYMDLRVKKLTNKELTKQASTSIN